MSIPDNIIIDYYDDGKVQYLYETNSHGELHGICVKWNNNGSLRELSTFKDGELHGIYCDWHSTGVRWEESYYVHDRLHGTRTIWHPNGVKLRTGEFVNGAKQGLHISWYSYNSIDEIRFYQNDEDISHQISLIVKDIQNITDYEKTQIALLYGFVL